MPNEEAARQTDPIGHGLGLLGLIGGAVLGAALIVGTGLTGGALAIAVCGAVAAGGLGGEQLVNGIMKAVDWKPQTGTIATGSPNVKIGNLPASRAVLDQSLSCHGLYGLHHFPFFPPTKIAEGAEIVAINGMPAARVDCKLVCGAVINHGQHNVLIGGPTVRLLNVISFDEFLHTFLVNLGLAAYVLSGPVGWTIGELIIKPIFDQLGEWGDDLGPGWRDIFQGGASLGMVLGGGLLLRSRTSTARSRLPQDEAVNPDPPKRLPWQGRRVGTSQAQHDALQADIQDAISKGATDIRVNQQQVNANGERVGINRPDLQYTLGDERYYTEYERPGAPRGVEHTERILANDPTGNVTVKEIPEN